MARYVKTPRATSSSSRRAGAVGWLMLSPMLAWIALFVVAPALILFVYSFCQRDELGQVVFSFTLDNYGRIFDPLYLKVFGRSLYMAALTTIICLVIGYPVAWYIARAPMQLRQRLLLLIMVPFWISFLLRTYAWITILKSEGVASGFLQWVQLASGPIDVLYSPTAVVLGLVYNYLPFMILPIYANAEKMDTSLVEAAFDLGASPIRAFATVIVPLTKPGIYAGALLVFVPCIGMFAITDLLGGARTPLLGNVIQSQFMTARDWPFGAALGVSFLSLFAIAFWLLQPKEHEE